MKATSVATSFAAKIRALFELAMRVVDVVQHKVLLDYISIVARKKTKK